MVYRLILILIACLILNGCQYNSKGAETKKEVGQTKEISGEVISKDQTEKVKLSEEANLHKQVLSTAPKAEETLYNKTGGDQIKKQPAGNDTSKKKAAPVEKKPVASNEKKEAPAVQKKYKVIKDQRRISITAAAANIRSGPGVTYSAISHMSKNETAQTDGKAYDGKTAWYHITYHANQKGWVSSAIVTNAANKPGPSEKSEKSASNTNGRRLDVALISQNPQLPRGCEVTSLAMLLNYAKKPVSKMTLANQIVKVPYVSNNNMGNPNDGFVGNMYTFSKPGLGVYHKPIADLARRYLGSRVVDLSNSHWSNVENQIRKGHPVWVIVNTWYRTLPAGEFKTWNTSRGNIRVTRHEHSVLITGFDQNYVYFNDPLASIKNRKAGKQSFEGAWTQMGKQAISYN